MTDDRKIHHNSTHVEQNKEPDFELLQNEFNAFLQQQNVVFSATDKKQSAIDSHNHTDQFIDSIQGDFDALLLQQTIPSTTTSAVHPQDESLKHIHPVDQALFDTVPTQPEQMPTESEPAAIKLPTTHRPSTRRSKRPLRNKFKVGILIAASCATATALWFFWPVEQPPVSQAVKQLQNHNTKQPMPTAMQAETRTDKATPVLTASEPAHSTGNPVIAAQKAPQQITIEANMIQPTTADNTLSVAARVGNIRNAPSRSGNVLFKLLRGTQVTKLSVQGEWFQVRLQNGTIAWAHYSIF